MEKKFTPNPKGLRSFKDRIHEGHDFIIGLRMIVAALALLPIFISKNPLIDAASAAIVTALVGWSIVSVRKLKNSMALIDTYTIIIDGERVTVDMAELVPLSIARKDITRIDRTEEAFIINGRDGARIIVPRDVDDPRELQLAIGEISCEMQTIHA